jgi:hypothetical protein
MIPAQYNELAVEYSQVLYLRNILTVRVPLSLSKNLSGYLVYELRGPVDVVCPSLAGQLYLDLILQETIICISTTLT